MSWLRSKFLAWLFEGTTEGDRIEQMYMFQAIATKHIDALMAQFKYLQERIDKMEVPR